VPARPYFPPIHLQPFYRTQFKYKRGDFPVTEAAGDACLALPFFGTMRVEQVDTVCGALVEALRASYARASRAEERVSA
jgi:perosamine synthetase